MPVEGDAYHEPVLLEEAVASLNCRNGGIYVDGTVGGGGHAALILERSAPDGFLLGMDVDGEALEAAGKRLMAFSRRKRELCRYAASAYGPEDHGSRRHFT